MERILQSESCTKGETDFGYEFYSVETGLLEREEVFTTAENGEVTTMVMTYSDFRDTGNGMYIPYVMEMNAGGQIIKFTMTEVIVKKKQNPKLLLEHLNRIF
ncbi:MAG: hypothetical protein IPO32_06270 [Crocinitomicaceae bacterium]|nr:hypothetical protein [Crocinitomicaceae bacterium]